LKTQSISAILKSVAILSFSCILPYFKEFLQHLGSETCSNEGKIFANFKGTDLVLEETFIIKKWKKE